MSPVKSKQPTPYIIYWCMECGGTIQYPDCGLNEVYQECLHCRGTITSRLCAFTKLKDVVIELLDRKRMEVNKALCGLLDVRYEDVIVRGGMHVVMAEWSNQRADEKRKLFDNTKKPR